MFINTDRFQEEYSMNLKRIVSLILALMLAVNTPPHLPRTRMPALQMVCAGTRSR